MAGQIIGAAVSAAPGLLGMIGQKKRNERAFQQQKDLNKQGQELGMKTWKETNYGPQMGMMKEAGLNPGLMYGGGGAGGGTVASASGGSAPQQPQMPMDIGSKMVEGAMMGQNLAESKSRERLNDANTKKLGGIDTEEGGQRIVESETRVTNMGVTMKTEQAKQKLIGLQGEYQNIMNEIGRATTANQIKQIAKNVNKTIEEIRALGIANKTDEATIQTTINKRKAEAIKIVLENKGIDEGIKQKWEEIGIKGDEMEIKKFATEVQAKYPNMMNVIGTALNDIYGMSEPIEGEGYGEAEKKVPTRKENAKPMW